jgi:hypothetical protein
MESKHDTPEACIRGINELLYDWNTGHAPHVAGTSGLESDNEDSDAQEVNCLWWNQRAEREGIFNSNDDGVDNTRKLIHTASLQTFNRKYCTPYRFSVDILEINDVNKKRVNNSWGDASSSKYLTIKSSDIESVTCNDNKEVRDVHKRKLGFHSSFNLSDKAGSFLEGENDYFKRIVPFNIYSSSVDSIVTTTFKDGIELTNLHHDTHFESKDIPLQGPFTEAHVGGLQHRHVGLNLKSGSSVDASRPYTRNLDNIKTRPEGWRINVTANGLNTYGPQFDPAGTAPSLFP